MPAANCWLLPIAPARASRSNDMSMPQVVPSRGASLRRRERRGGLAFCGAATWRSPPSIMACSTSTSSTCPTCGPPCEKRLCNRAAVFFANHITVPHRAPQFASGYDEDVEVEQAMIDGGERQVAALRSNLRVFNAEYSVGPLARAARHDLGHAHVVRSAGPHGAMGNSQQLAAGIAWPSSRPPQAWPSRSRPSCCTCITADELMSLRDGDGFAVAAAGGGKPKGLLEKRHARRCGGAEARSQSATTPVAVGTKPKKR